MSADLETMTNEELMMAGIAQLIMCKRAELIAKHPRIKNDQGVKNMNNVAEYLYKRIGINPKIPGD